MISEEEQRYNEAYYEWYLNADIDDDGVLKRKMLAAKEELDKSRERQ